MSCGFQHKTHQKMKGKSKTAKGMKMQEIFRCMMEEGYQPEYEKTHILFTLDDNTGVVEYEENILSIRIFFSIEPDAFSLFLEASNSMMLETYMVKPVIMDDRKSIMFSCEMMCDSVREFRKFFHRGVEYIIEALMMHKAEMKRLILADTHTMQGIPAMDDSSVAGIAKSHKVVS